MTAPQFYCETCGTEVPLDVDTCPHCLSDFVSVQCPRCRFRGKPQLFAQGCPKCGFSPAAHDTGRAGPGRTPEVSRRRASRGWLMMVVAGLSVVLLALVAVLIIQ